MASVVLCDKISCIYFHALELSHSLKNIHNYDPPDFFLFSCFFTLKGT